MAQQKTWDANRTGGGTYEFSRDAQGNYVLNSVGFQKFGKLNLPDLGKSTTQTTQTTKDTTKDTATASAQTKQAFGNVQPFYYEEGGRNRKQYTMKKEGDLSTDTKPMTTGDGPWTMRTGKADRPEMLGDYGFKKSDIPVKEPAPYLKKREDWYTDIDSPMGPDLKKTEEAKKLPADYTGASTYYKGIDEAPLGKGVRQEKDVLAQKTVDKYPGMVGPQKPSPYQDAIMRGERGVKYEKPVIPKTELTQTALKAVNTGSSVLAKAVGFVMDRTMIGSVLKSMKETPMNKHDKGYFNVDNTGKIVKINPTTGKQENASTGLYVGMNRVSMRGDLGKAGLSRISKRNSAKTQANLDRLGPERKAAFNAKTKAMQKEAIDYGKSQTKVMKNVPPSQRGNGSEGNTRVICTELHSTGEMSTRDWIRDIRFTYKDLSKEHIKGYLFWAVPTVEHIKKYPTYRKFWKHIAQHRANDIAWRLNQGKFDLLGRIYAGIGEPLCWLIGKCVSNKQIKELELNNWRKA